MNPSSTAIGKVIVHYAGGGTAEFPVRNRHELANWWSPADQDNGLVAYRESNKSAQVGFYLSRFPLAKGRGRPVSVTLETAGGPLWIVLAATLSDVDRPLQKPKSWTVVANEEWKPMDTSHLEIVPGSALDLSGLFPPTGGAGSEGFAKINDNGAIVFEKNPDRPVRFFCDASQMTFLHTITPEKAERFADQIAREGYNIYRPQYLELSLMQGSHEDGMFNPEQLDRWDLLAAALKKRGVYLCLDLMAYDGSYYALSNPWGQEASAKRLRSRLYYDGEARVFWKKVMGRLLDHVNPYTGLALKDEPQVAVMEMRNETFLEFLMATRGRNPDIVIPFRAWLKKRYGTTEKLREAWSRKEGVVSVSYLPSDQTIDTVRLPNYSSDKPPSKDLHRFYTDIERETYRWMEAEMRTMGARCLLTDYNACATLQEQLTRDIVPIADNHSYHDLPSDDVRPGSTIDNVSSLASGVGYYRYLAGTRHWGRPYFCTEWDHCFWNAYRYEAGLTVPAYAAFQNWNLLAHFATRDELVATPIVNTVFSIDPPLRAAEYMGALFFRRGDVRPSQHRVEVKIDPGPALDALPLQKALSTGITQLSLVTGLGVRVVGMPDPAPRAPYRPDWTIVPDEGEAILSGGGVQKVIEGKAPATDRDNRLNSQLRDLGILRDGNRTNLAEGIYESDTGQILLNKPKLQISVITPLSQGTTMAAGPNEASLPGLNIKNSGSALSVFVGSLTTEPLPESRRLLLIVATDALNSGMVFDSEQRHQVVTGPGALPVLMRTAQVEIRFKHERADALQLWALGIDGTRRERIPLKIAKNVLTALIDTGKLQNGPTPFFEIAEEPEKK